MKISRKNYDKLYIKNSGLGVNHLSKLTAINHSCSCLAVQNSACQYENNIYCRISLNLLAIKINKNRK